MTQYYFLPDQTISKCANSGSHHQPVNPLSSKLILLMVSGGEAREQRTNRSWLKFMRGLITRLQSGQGLVSQGSLSLLSPQSVASFVRRVMGWISRNNLVQVQNTVRSSQYHLISDNTDNSVPTLFTSSISLTSPSLDLVCPWILTLVLTLPLLLHSWYGNVPVCCVPWLPLSWVQY